jgi:murein DD-endopeptidase MepM/ murein hydrolase activator NlpD
MIPDVSLTGLKPGEAADPKAVAAKVQSMFTEVMIKAMEDSVGAEDGLFGGSASSDIYRGMLNEQLAVAMSSQMKSPLEGELSRSLSHKSTNDAGSFPEAARCRACASPTAPAESLPVSGVISSPLGWRKDPINGEMKYHGGTDIAAPLGTPIRAVADGRVIESGPKGTYGNAVVIQAEDGRKMLYAHNNQNFVQVGDRVSQGDQIAEVGATGRATGPHVHFEVKF